MALDSRIKSLPRWILTVGLLVGVHHEAGVWTAVCIGLCGVASELAVVQFRKIEDRISRIERVLQIVMEPKPRA